MRLRVIWLCFILSVVAAVGAIPLAAQEVMTPNRKLDLYVSQSVVVNLSSPAQTVFVAEPEIASYQVVSPERLILFGRLPGKTTLVVMDAGGEPVYTATLSVKYDTTQMAEALAREFPSLNLKLTPAADGIAVSGLVPSAQVASDVIALLDSFVQLGRPSAMTASLAGSSQSEGSSSSSSSDTSGAASGRGTLASRYGKIINRLTITMPNQVTIRVRVAEVSRNMSERLGIKWFANQSGTYNGKGFFFGLADSAVASFENISALAGVEPVADFAALIDALAEESLVSVLAEPNLSVLSGETASFLAGGQVPFPVDQGDGAVTIEFKDFGVILGVTPTVLSPERVSLRLRPEVSEPSVANGITVGDTHVPGFVVRRAETTIELASGQSFAIGGLLQSNLTNEVSKFPFLGDIPIFGALARSTAFQRGETELVIIATAYIAEPSGGNLQIPNAQISVPTSVERLFLGSKPKVSPGPLEPGDFLYY
ncbi:MAG: type II and III secretion system protein family protein [Deltaproteobacteria bacterium]|jgi:pilus assembly protein CpaC|nr:type II and III secretion system protein family protein [Deltaproteobacteria bacterium]